MSKEVTLRTKKPDFLRLNHIINVSLWGVDCLAKTTQCRWKFPHCHAPTRHPVVLSTCWMQASMKSNHLYLEHSIHQTKDTVYHLNGQFGRACINHSKTMKSCANKQQVVKVHCICASGLIHQQPSGCILKQLQLWQDFSADATT